MINPREWARTYEDFFSIMQVTPWTAFEIVTISRLHDELSLFDGVEYIKPVAGCTHQTPCDEDDRDAPCNKGR
jgi:hypothetical protein